MSADNDRGWNIVGKRARPGWMARLMGKTKSGELPVVAILFWSAAILTGTKLLGLW